MRVIFLWTVVPVGDRNTYMAALEKASVGEDIGPCAEFLAKLVEKRLAGEPLPAVPKGAKAIRDVKLNLGKLFSED